MAARFRKILCPMDFSPNSIAVLDFALKLIDGSDATMLLINVVPSPVGASAIPPVPLEPYPIVEETARARLKTLALERLEGKVGYEVAACSGDPATEIVSAAGAFGADLIVMATHGRTGLKHFFLGSVAERVVRESPVPVLTIRPT